MPTNLTLLKATRNAKNRYLSDILTENTWHRQTDYPLERITAINLEQAMNVQRGSRGIALLFL
jgi:hypothetical protein